MIRLLQILTCLLLMVMHLVMLNLRVLVIILRVVFVVLTLLGLLVMILLFLNSWRLNNGSASAVQYAGIDDLFKCRASLLYPIFVNQWSGTVNDDKLLIGSVNTCVAVRPFSVYGLPYSK